MLSNFRGTVQIASVNNSTFSYTDNSVVIDDPGQTIYYKVKAFGPNQFTNTVSTTVTPYKINSGIRSSTEFNYALEQNYPNPFNPSTSISFSILTKGKVLLKIFDVLGNEIAILIDGEFEPGFYSADFNAENLSSGIYFYTIITNDFMQTNKMILAK